MISEEDVVKLIARAMTLVEKRRPLPSHLTITQAAEMLNMSPKTFRKLNLPRNKAGRIAYATLEPFFEASSR